MTLYDIDSRILAVLEQVDPETGEILPEAEKELLALDMEREQKIENVACYLKETKAALNALREERTRLTARMAVEEKRQERLEKFLAMALGGEKFKTAKVSISYRNSESVQVEDGFNVWAAMNNRTDLLTIYEPAPNKTAIKEFIKSGGELEHAWLVSSRNMIVK